MEVLQVRIWTFQVSGSAKYVMQRGVGLPASDATSVMLHVTRFLTTLPWVLWDGRPLSRAVLVIQLGALDQGMFLRGIRGMSLFQGLVLAPVLPEQRLEKREKPVNFFRLLQSFCLVQVLVAPEPKREKTREQELADRVKSLERLRSQEATHKGQIDKLELDLQCHRDMLQGVLVRIREESEECGELRAQVAGERAPASESTLSEAVPVNPV